MSLIFPNNYSYGHCLCWDCLPRGFSTSCLFVIALETFTRLAFWLANQNAECQKCIGCTNLPQTRTILVLENKTPLRYRYSYEQSYRFLLCWDGQNNDNGLKNNRIRFTGITVAIKQLVHENYILIVPTMYLFSSLY